MSPGGELREGDRFFREKVHVGSGQGRTPEGKDGHPFLSDPLGAHLRLRKLLRAHGRPGAEPEALQGADCREDVLAVQGEHQIEIRREAEIPVQHDGDPSHDYVADVLLVESRQDPADVVGRHCEECSLPPIFRTSLTGGDKMAAKFPRPP